MRKTDLKPLQITDLIEECVYNAMEGRVHLTCSRLRRAFTMDPEDVEIKALNKALILLELETRKKMKELITTFIEDDKQPV